MLCSKQGPYVRDSPSDPADWPELSVPSPLGGLPVLSFLSERSLPNRTLRTASGWLAQPILSLRLPLVGANAPLSEENARIIGLKRAGHGAEWKFSRAGLPHSALAARALGNAVASAVIASALAGASPLLY